MKKYHKIEAVRFWDDELRIKIDGHEHKFKFSSISVKLANASEMEKLKFEISPSGYGSH